MLALARTAPVFRLGLGSAASALEFWLRKNLETRLKLKEKVYLEKSQK